MSDRNYPPIEANSTGFLKVSELHTIYYEECGSGPQPVIVLHGGPGAGSSPVYRQFFDPAAYRIIQFDQRGCGKWPYSHRFSRLGQSTPWASLEENTTWDLVEDTEKLRVHLGIEKWVVFGGSWGSTLSLAYAEKHTDRVGE
jgi:proline iminopeptidase